MELSEDELVAAISRVHRDRGPERPGRTGRRRGRPRARGRRARRHRRPPRRACALRARVDRAARPGREGDRRERVGYRGDGRFAPVRAGLGRPDAGRRRRVGHGARGRDARGVPRVRHEPRRRGHQSSRPDRDRRDRHRRGCPRQGRDRARGPARAMRSSSPGCWAGRRADSRSRGRRTRSQPCSSNRTDVRCSRRCSGRPRVWARGRPSPRAARRR